MCLERFSLAFLYYNPALSVSGSSSKGQQVWTVRWKWQSKDWYVTVESVLRNWDTYIIMKKERKCLGCVCWLTDHGLFFKSWRQVNCSVIKLGLIIVCHVQAQPLPSCACVSRCSNWFKHISPCLAIPYPHRQTVEGYADLSLSLDHRVPNNKTALEQPHGRRRASRGAWCGKNGDWSLCVCVCVCVCVCEKAIQITTT